MQKRIWIGVFTVMALGGCAEYQKPMPKRTLAHRPAPVAEYKKPAPVTTQSITPVAGPATTLAPTPTTVLAPIPVLAPTPALAPAPTPGMSLEEQLRAAWKHVCGLRNVEHVEKGRINETEEQKHFIDEKCAEARWDSHMQ